MPREVERPDWQIRPFRMEVTHGGDKWNIAFVPVNPEPEDDYQCSWTPGWLTPAELITIIDRIDQETQGACVNVAEAKMDLAEKKADGIVHGFIKSMVSQAKMAQGSVVCYG